MSERPIGKQLSITEVAPGGFVHSKQESEDAASIAASSAAVPSPKAVKESAGKSKSLAPMLRQYLEHKEKYPEHIVLFQVGDFYEIFYQDAEKAASVLDIRLTARHKDQPNPVPMCGFPVHGLRNYLPKLVKAGMSAVVVSQTESDSEKQGGSKKGMVSREIERIITPGIRYLEDGLDEKSFNYLASACLGPGGGGLNWIDVSTGQLYIRECESELELLEVFQCVSPAEVILPSVIGEAAVSAAWLAKLKRAATEINCRIVYRPFSSLARDRLRERVIKLLPNNLAARDREMFSSNSPIALGALKVLLDYVEDLSFSDQLSLSQVSCVEPDKTVLIDSATRRNLEIVRSGEQSNQSLVSFMDQAKTAFGSRLLRERLLAPSIDIEEISSSHQAIENLLLEPSLADELREKLAVIRDLERLATRIISARISPYDLGVLRQSLEVFPFIKEKLEECTAPYLLKLAESLDTLEDIFQLLTKALCVEPPIKITEGGAFAEGYSPELDELRLVAQDGRSCLNGFEEQQKKQTGIHTLKVRYNNAFGYFIEVTKANIARVPDLYQRKQTLTNAERYVTEELKELEVKILSAKARQISLEKELFTELKKKISPERGRVQAAARILAEIDLLTSAAFIARQFNHTRPRISESGQTKILGGRHPVVEGITGASVFVPNDTNLCSKDWSGAKKNQPCETFAILSGPNMGGKSTYLRQVGIIQLLAQAGFFVPADRAEIGIVDRIFTRIGASDDLARGESTFMVEMREASVIARRATSNSLVLVDELGRGTATADGFALATAIAEWLHDEVGCRTIFATHFHQLAALSESHPNIFCLSVGVEEREQEISFTYQIENKPADRSYGIEVAKLAGLPEQILNRASQILAGGNSGANESLASRVKCQVLPDPKSDRLTEELQGLDLESLSPLEALNELFRLKSKIHDRH